MTRGSDIAGSRLTGYELWRLETPTGRVIGDNNCHYASLDVVALCLRTADERRGWGYGETCWKGVFKIPAWYIQPMIARTELLAAFERDWWPRLQGRDPQKAATAAGPYASGLVYLDAAVHQALWDLRAQQAGQPLWQLLGGPPGRSRVRAYGSLLDFPLTEDETVALANRFVARGFRTLKVKIGADDVARDIRRLQAIRQAVGPAIELTADANQIWNAETALDRLRAIDQAGIRLGYIEDPLPYTDVAGFARLNRALPIDVVGHDYAPNPAGIRALLEAGGINRIRNGRDIEHALGVAQLAREFQKPMIFGNSMFEANIHLACALPGVDRLEFSDLAWNELMAEPVRFEDGYGIAPTAPGHGLQPNPDVLQQWRRDTA